MGRRSASLLPLNSVPGTAASSGSVDKLPLDAVKIISYERVDIGYDFPIQERKQESIERRPICLSVLSSIGSGELFRISARRQTNYQLANLYTNTSLLLCFV